MKGTRPQLHQGGEAGLFVKAMRAVLGPYLSGARYLMDRKSIPSWDELMKVFEEQPGLPTGITLSLLGVFYISMQEMKRSSIAKAEESKAREAASRKSYNDFQKLLESYKQTPKTRLIALIKRILAGAKKSKAKADKPKTRKRGVSGLDGQFILRLRAITKIVIPAWNCRETMLLGVLTILLVTRSLLSVHTAKISGAAMRCIITRDKKVFWFFLANFFLTGIASAIVNSGLKFLTNAVTTAFRNRLTHHVHDMYMANRSYYKASVLRTGQLDNPDQRVVEDLLKFCETFSDLFSRTFKPALDVMVSTIQMAQSMGFAGPSMMYLYFIIAGNIVRAVSPKFSNMIARRANIEGDFRRVHTRIIQNAEEIAFLEGEGLEKQILNEKLRQVSDYSSRYFLKQFGMGIFDQWMFKYGASCVGIPILVIPFLADTEGSAADLTTRYFTCNSLIQQASGSLSELLLVYKKFQKLSGFTSRVMELLEAIEQNRNAEASAEGLSTEHESKDRIGFEKVSIFAPDGRLLLKDLTMDIESGVSLMITGINGAGKTSLFRVLSGLWKGRGGAIWRPRSFNHDDERSGKISLFYMPQNPYLVTGTLRDQITYPLRIGDKSRDKEIKALLAKVGLSKFLDTEKTFLAGEEPEGLDISHHDWADVLSGGEKQRVGWARLYFHKPSFAILDEATSAINPDEEGRLYEELCKLRVTFFSIAHRLDLRRFHQKELNLAGDGTGAYTLTEIKSA
eukprot:CAMPEP_0114509212 /NCGR_PEP_ID=MMETSP0109-20121206/13076_1 /TAXON_ID=29199 /ORGANISM="Chlorarachnion reptans, Strain CCCM449" /LENGTH=736 /DNA_ID=CAMNT_0001688323 /DNA_START=90 /DNA_END=2300 /DNA_ORIENTATION=-